MTQTVLTYDGDVTVETGIPLEQLQLGDTVLGRPDPDDPSAPRTTHVVTATFGKHHVPCEDPSRLEQFLIKAGLQWTIAGGRMEGVLTEGKYGPGLFALDPTPVLDRVIF
jgi:hypothetical protein